MNKINIIKNNDAIDAYFFSKRDGFEAIIQRFDISLERIAVIGDGENDLPFLSYSGIGLKGAPSNARDEVKAYLGDDNVMFQPGLDGFLEFYERCAENDIKLIVSDKDGVLQWHDDKSKLSLVKIWENMGKDGCPLITVLTGASIASSLGFIRQYGLIEASHNNALIKHTPELVFAENGYRAINIINQDVMPVNDILDVKVCQKLTGQFKEMMIDRLETELLSSFGLKYSGDRTIENKTVYIPDKHSMLTVCLPKMTSCGDYYLDTCESEMFRNKIIDEMSAIAKQLNLAVINRAAS